MRFYIKHRYIHAWLQLNNNFIYQEASVTVTAYFGNAIKLYKIGRLVFAVFDLVTSANFISYASINTPCALASFGSEFCPIGRVVAQGTRADGGWLPITFEIDSDGNVTFIKWVDGNSGVWIHASCCWISRS